jgi:ferrochelatase
MKSIDEKTAFFSQESSPMNSQSPKGVLLVNLGTPDAPETGPVRRYLREFLSDPRVIDIPRLARFLLLNLIILPLRPKKSAAAYASIWSHDGLKGSPLLAHGRALQSKVQALLGRDYVVSLGMRYGNPSLHSAVNELERAGTTSFTCLPLFPQYSSAANGSAVEEVMRVVKGRWNIPGINFLGAFYDHPGFLDAFAEISRPQLEAFRPDFVVFSYHGLPERHMHKSDPTGRHCLSSPHCCDRIVPANRFCYRAQCFVTTRGLVERLGLEPGRFESTFQSRLGRTPWIKPYTDEFLPELAKKGVRRVAVLCPAFVADCLETLEEIGDRARADWKAAGGEELTLVTSLNSHDVWAKVVADMVR